MAFRFVFPLLLVVSLAGCASPEPPAAPAATEPLFSRLSPQRTGIEFANTLSQHPSPQRNRLLYEYFSNGAGVAAGDLNGDGLDDLFFTGNMTYSRLYLNRGGLRFDDITDPAGIAGRPNTWKTGVSMADVNGDGRLDVYVCYSGDLPLDRRIDELYINQGVDEAGIPRFREMAAEYGLAQPHSSNQAYFFDYDRDGDLDLFLLTHNVKNLPLLDADAARAAQQEDDPVSGVRLYRNTGNRFEDATRSAGLSSSALTYGLGAGIADIDNDGWTDIYIGNDYSPPDYLYVNQGDGTFKDELGQRMGHTSNASMGVDAADIDNDGWLDLAVLDMLGESNLRQKTLFVPNDRAVFETVVASGFHHQYMRNTLQLNNGNGSFSEIGQLAGVAGTDWSWTPLFADFDNDGWKDLFVTNGILHDATDRDFLAFQTSYVAQKRGNLQPDDVAFLMSRLPAPDLSNYAFKNSGALRFDDVSAEWGLGQPLKSTGGVYADLDNDGDLDLVTNNINEYAFVFENHAAEALDHAYLQIALHGEAANTAGIGSRVSVYAGGAAQHLEQMPARGYLSSVSPTLHFGLGDRRRIDSVRVVWPDGRMQSLTGLEVNRRLEIRQRDAEAANKRSVQPPPVTFEQIPSPIVFTHQIPAGQDDFQRQPLLDHPLSDTGPPIVQGDVNGDGLADVFIGGGSGQAGKLFLQRSNGRFTDSRQPAFDADAQSHDADALFFDYDGDGHLDLYVASGGYGVFAPDDAALQDRLYKNDGAGSFAKARDALPAMPTSTGVVAANDIDADGRPDLFVGGRVVPGRYPEPPASYVLMNDGRGGFRDRTVDLAPLLKQAGMITDAVWHDLDDDGVNELIVAGLWMPIRVFSQSGAAFSETTDTYFGRPYRGLWHTLLIADVNGDGRADLLAGNLGANAQLTASETSPAALYYGDFDNDGAVDPLLAYDVQGIRYPHATLDELRAQMPAVAAQFSSHHDYARTTLDALFADGRLADASILEADHLETTLFFSTAAGRFEPQTLPVQAQFAPVHAATAADFDRDGRIDLLLAGNTLDGPIRFGKYDANYGVLLRGKGQGGFEYVPQHLSGLSLRGAVRSVARYGDTLVFGVYGGEVAAVGF